MKPYHTEDPRRTKGIGTEAPLGRRGSVSESRELGGGAFTC